MIFYCNLANKFVALKFLIAKLITLFDRGIRNFFGNYWNTFDLTMLLLALFYAVAHVLNITGDVNLTDMKMQVVVLLLIFWGFAKCLNLSKCYES